MPDISATPWRLNMIRLFNKKDKDGNFIRSGKTGTKFYFKTPKERGDAMRSAAAERQEERKKERKNAAKKTE